MVKEVQIKYPLIKLIFKTINPNIHRFQWLENAFLSVTFTV